MGAIDNFLKRWGFAKLDRYGLVLTADDRVISTRPAILDDGLGGKIVGWLEDDLAAMELERWGASKPARPKRLTAPASLHKLPSRQAPLAPRTVAPAAPAPSAPDPAPHVETPASAPIAASPARPLPGVAPVIAPPATPAVAEADEPGEDEWEWEIAMARARAAAEEEQQAPMVRPAPAPAPRKMIMAKTSPGIAAVPATSPKLLHPEPEPLPPWPGTEPYNESWADKSEVAPQVMSVLQKKLALQRSTPARATPIVSPPAAAPPRSTVIPVPQLPTAADPRSVRPAPYSPSASRARVARGTGAPATKLEETVRTLAAPPAANDDRTSPYITLPNEVKPSGFAHTKRVAAKAR